MIQKSGSQLPGLAPPETKAGGSSVFASGTGESPTSENSEQPCDRVTLASGSEIPPQEVNHEKIKVLIVHGSHTGGHASAARAVEKALGQMPGVEVKNINALDLANPKEKNGQIAIFKALGGTFSKVRSWAFRKSFEGSPLVYWLGNTGMKLKSLASKQFLNRIREEDPDIILSTHSPMNSLMSYWKGRGLIDAPVHSAVTDFGAHRMWAQENIERYYVATEEVRKDLERFGAPEEKITVTGIPVDPSFNTLDSRSKEEVKEQLGLDPNLPLVLMLGGSLGYGNFAAISKELDITPYPLQMAVITGKNAAKRQELEALSQSLDKKLEVQGFVNNMRDWMKASDVVISKPGGLTTSELFAMKKPMILINPDPGFEGMLVPKITATGCAALAKDEKEAAAIAAKVIFDPHLRESMEERLQQVGKPGSADAVARDLVESVIKRDGSDFILSGQQGNPRI